MAESANNIEESSEALFDVIVKIPSGTRLEEIEKLALGPAGIRPDRVESLIKALRSVPQAKIGAGVPRARATVSARAEGLTLIGPGRRSVDLEPATPQELRFGFRAERPGRARLSVDASAPQDKAPPATDAVDLTRNVVLPIALETAAVSGDTAAAPSSFTTTGRLPNL